jgi:hypothetical protein
LTVTGCGGVSEGEPEAAAEVDEVSGKQPVPAILTSVESSAEDIVDLAVSRDRRNAVAEAERLEAATDGRRLAALTRSGVRAATIARLKERASRLAWLAHNGAFVDVALAANSVSELMPGLYGRFQNPVPAAILTLDYLDREAQFRSLAGADKQVARAVTELARTWNGVRAKVVAAGGKREAAAYSRHVAAMRRLAPGAAKKVRAEAVHGLELVDQMEQVFAR